MTTIKSFSQSFRKAAVWKMTQDESIPPFERAIYSTFCGNIGQLLSVCKTWEDYLWAYTKGKVISRF